MSNTLPHPVPQLAQLHDIHLPTPIGWWPLAPGWIVLICLVLCLALRLSHVIRCRYLHGRARRQALRTLTDYEKQHRQHPNSQRSSALISELLKRVALAYYPREQVAGLQGDAWLTFLNETMITPKKHLNPIRNALLEYPYQPPQSCNLDPLFTFARAWIKLQEKGSLLDVIWKRTRHARGSSNE